MSFGTTPDTLAYQLIFMLAVLPLGIVLLALGGLLRRLLPIDSTPLAILVTGLPLVGVVVGGSLYLDQVGVVRPAQVVTKTETIRFREEGDWWHDYAVQVTYTTPDGTAPSARFSTTAAVFDALQEGDSTAVRTISVNGWFDLARLADQSTWTWIPWRWVGIGGAVFLLLWVGWQFLQNKTGCALLVAVALVIFVTPFVFKFLEWQRSSDLSPLPLRASGVVTQMERVTEIDPIPGNSSGGDEWETQIEAVQPYDIVVVRYTPQGYTDPVLGVDAIDVDSQPVALDKPVELAYASSDPRTVRLLQGTRSHHWKNPVEWLKQQALAGLVVLAFLGGITWLGRWWQRLVASRAGAVKSRVR